MSGSESLSTNLSLRSVSYNAADDGRSRKTTAQPDNVTLRRLPERAFTRTGGNSAPAVRRARRAHRNTRRPDRFRTRRERTVQSRVDDEACDGVDGTQNART